MADSKGIAAFAKSVESDYSPEAGLHRRLTERQLSMIAIGGAIGVGLFLGTSISISLAGPGLIVTYLLGAVIAVVVAYVIAEMAVVHPARVHSVSMRKSTCTLGQALRCARLMPSCKLLPSARKLRL